MCKYLTFLFAAYLLAATASSAKNSPDSVSTVEGCLARHDEAAFQKQIESNRYRVRKPLYGLIYQRMRRLADHNRTTKDSIDAVLSWSLPVYDNATGVHDLTGMYERYRHWKPEEANRKLYLDSLLKSYVSMSPTLSGADSIRTLLPQYMKIPDSIGWSSTCFYLGDLFFKLEKADSAKHYLIESLNCAKSLGQLDRIASCDLLLSDLLSRYEGNPFLSEKHLFEAIDCYERLGARSSVASAEIRRAINQFDAARYESAIDLAARAADLSRDMLDTRNLSYALYLIGECYYNLEQYDSSLAYASRSREIRERRLHEIQSGTKPGSLESAQSYVAASIGLAALTMHAQGRFWDAEQLFAETDSLVRIYGDVDDLCLYRGRWAWLRVDEGLNGVAAEFFKENLINQQRFEDWFDAAYGLAVCNYREGKAGRASEILNSLIDQLESNQKQIPDLDLRSGSIADKMRAYDLLASIYLDEYVRGAKRDCLDSAIRIVNLSKARSLQSTRPGLEKSAEGRVLDSLTAKKARLLAMSIANGADSTRLSNELRDVTDSLDRYKIEAVPTNLQRNRDYDRRYQQSSYLSSVPDGVAILIFQISPYGCYTVILTRAGPSIYQPSMVYDSLKAAVRTYRGLLDNYPTSDYDEVTLKKLGHRLQAALVPDFVIEDTSVQHLIFVPGDMLYNLPLEALTDSDGKYLCERFEISYALTCLRDSHSSPAESSADSHKSITVFGNPDIPANARQFQNLQYSGVEAKAVAATWGSANIRSFTDQEATSENFRTLDFRNTSVLHLTTHAYADNRDPGRSGIICTSVDGLTPGLLTSEEIKRLHIPVDLVYMSACETGAGRIQPGEGVMSLARPFFAAGARSALVTLWSVDDHSAAKIAASFYGHLRSGDTFAEALVKAQREMIHSDISLYRHPYFWAPYVLIHKP